MTDLKNEKTSSLTIAVRYTPLKVRLSVIVFAVYVLSRARAVRAQGKGCTGERCTYPREDIDHRFFENLVKDVFTGAVRRRCTTKKPALQLLVCHAHAHLCAGDVIIFKGARSGMVCKLMGVIVSHVGACSAPLHRHDVAA